MEYEVTFPDEESAVRAAEHFTHLEYHSIRRDRNKVNLVSDDLNTYNPTRTSGPWNFEFERPIVVAPVLRLSSVGDYLQYLENGDFSDIELDVGMTEEKRFVFRAHRIVLTRASAFFPRLLSERWNSEKVRKVVIEYDIDEFRQILELMYGKAVVLDGVAGLLFLEKLDYWVLEGVDVTSLIANMNIPPADDFLKFVTLLRARYTEIPPSINELLDTSIDQYYDDDQPPEFFREFWSLLPSNITKNSYYVLEPR